MATTMNPTAPSASRDLRRWAWILGIVASFALVAPAVAELPLPLFPECGLGGACPNEYDPLDDWELGSGQPADELNIPDAERAFGSGGWVDRAWNLTTGRTDVVIAVMDSGIQWGQGELLNKHFLNPGELPFPQNAAGEDNGTYDLNGDGLHNIQDWIQDPRVSPDAAGYADLHAHELIDPSDLIAIFSDGVDDDGNGYIDDISGWDFFWNDNDPYDEIQQDGYSHGSKEGRWSAAEGNGAGGSIGSCPNCMLLNLRCGDGFVADVNNFAMATLYAVDMGVAVIQEALGTLNNTQLAIDSIEYAWDRGVVIIGSAADETAWHHNLPAANHHIVYTHSIRHDSTEAEDAHSWFAFSNCTNYGARLDLSVAAEGCSSGAVGRGAGMAGLIVSAVRDAVDDGVLDGPLTSNELYQLIIHSVDDVAFNPLDDDPDRYPSHPGWDQHFGYGRLNAFKAVSAVYAGEIPPEADLLSPDWFAVYNLGTTSSIEVTGLARARRADGLTWELQVAGGADPRDTDFEVVASGNSAIEGPLMTLNLRSLPLDPGAVIEPMDRFDTNVSKVTKAHLHSVTLRMVVLDSEGRRGEMRKMIYVHDDPDLLPGYPRKAGVSIESSVTLVDVDGDGIDDVVYVNSDGILHVTDATGADKPGWPQKVPLLEATDPDSPRNHLGEGGFTSGAASTDARHAAIGTPAIGDLDGDGDVEIVLATLDGALLVYEHTGALRWTYWLDRDRVVGVNLHDDTNYDYGFFSSPALGDLDQSGGLDIVVGGMDGQVHVLNGAGDALPGFPLELKHTYETAGGPQARGERIISSPAIGDIDGDGRLEIAIGTNQKTTGTYGMVYVINHDGTIADGWPFGLFGAYTNALPFVGEGVPGSPALCDVDGDGKLEIGTHTIADSGKILSWDGTEFARLARIADDFGPYSNTAESSANLIMINSGAWGDLNMDGTPDYMIGSMGFDYATGLLNDGRRYDHDHHLGAWTGVVTDGRMDFLPAWPRIMEDMQFFLNPSVVDIDGDGRPEAINASAGNIVHAFDIDGNEPAGWPKNMGSWIIGSPTVGDADGDGYLEVWGAARNGYLFAWRTTSLAETAYRGWVGFRHDPRNTGNCETALRTYPPIEEEGCSACAGGGSFSGRTGAGFSALLLVLLALGRRPRQKARQVQG
jgi:hypothetical protein